MPSEPVAGSASSDSRGTSYFNATSDSTKWVLMFVIKWVVCQLDILLFAGCCQSLSWEWWQDIPPYKRHVAVRERAATTAERNRQQEQENNSEPYRSYDEPWAEEPTHLQADQQGRAVQDIRDRLSSACWWGMMTSGCVRLGHALQAVSYIWGTAVVLGGLVTNLNDSDYWVVSVLVLVGGMVLLCNNMAYQFFMLWVPGYLKDGFSGNVLPLLEHNLEYRRPRNLVWILLMIAGRVAMGLGIAGVCVSLWRVMKIGSTYSSPKEARTLASLHLFYIIFIVACTLIMIGNVWFRFKYGDSHVHNHTDIGKTLLVFITEFVPQADRFQQGGQETGLSLCMLKWHYEHIHRSVVLSGLQRSMVYATPLGFLWQEYYFLNDRKLDGHNRGHYSRDLFNLIQLFYAHGANVERLLIERWKAGCYDAPVMLIVPKVRPGYIHGVDASPPPPPCHRGPMFPDLYPALPGAW